MRVRPRLLTILQKWHTNDQEPTTRNSTAGRTPRPISTATIRYVRNRRPNTTMIWVEGKRLRLEPRGRPGDVLAVPEALLDDPDIAGYIDFGWLEEVEPDELVPRFR